MDKKIQKRERAMSCVWFAVLMMSLLPVMYLGRYNHPVGDDYYYGAETRHVWEETQSLAATMAEAARGTAYQYEQWQGTYSAMFLMHLPPNIFGDTAYRFVTAGILFLLTGGIFYLLKQVICGLLKGPRTLWLATASLLTLLCVQTVPSQGETFFWYNGSMYYTGYYAVTLFMFGLLIRYLMKAKWYHLPLIALLAVFLAGGNYVSLLPAILIMALITTILIFKKSKCAAGAGLVTALMILGLLISAAAPGNAVRQSGMWKIEPHMAVLKSLLQGIKYIQAWIGRWWIAAILLLTPMLWNSFARISFRFPYPVPVLGFAYGIFCSMSCPLFYTMNSTGPARAVAIVYYGFMLFTFFCYVYALGYLYRVLKEKQMNVWNKGLLYTGAAVLVMIQLFAGSAVQTTTGKAVELLVSGEAYAYEQEYQERMAVLNDPTIKDVVFLPYEHQPDMLFVGDMPGDAMDETNQKTAAYFLKDSVRVQYD